MALIFNIQRFSVNDGPGIRTNVFFKGCPLNCLWCHNPESKSTKPDLGFIASKCIGCGHCLTQCPGHCHTMENGEHVIDRSKCLACRACERFCAGALEIMGREMTVDEVLGEVMKDEIFYKTSNGGMTVSGGEPMIQFPFITELLRAAKEKGLTCCMETCGFAAWAGQTCCTAAAGTATRCCPTRKRSGRLRRTGTAASTTGCASSSACPSFWLRAGRPAAATS